MELSLAWALATIAALAATTMIAVGMFEELPGMIRGVWLRAFKRRRS